MTATHSSLHSDILIVGAGLSGLRAAVELHKAGLSATVLEAMDRVGGKTLSVPASSSSSSSSNPPAPGSTHEGMIELGAAWINDTNQSEMYKLALEFGFDLIQQRAEGLSLQEGSDGTVKSFTYGSDAPGASPKEEEVLRQYVALINKHVADANPEQPHLSPEAGMLDSMTFKEYAEHRFPGGVAAAAADSFAAALLGVEADEVSALYMVDYFQSGTGMHNMGSDGKDGGQYLRNRQGNHTFSLRLAAQLPEGSIHLSTPVERIIQQPSGCLVRTRGYADSEQTYRAKRVIVSLPTTLLPSIVFDPPLPPAKSALASSTALGYYAKTVFVFDRPWWREAGLSGVMESAKGPISFTRDTCSEDDNQFSITCFLVGDHGRQWSKWSAAERRRQVTAQFDSVYGKTVRDKGVDVPRPVNVIEKEWVKDACARGAPSPVLMPGGLTNDAGKAIREPFGHVHFVGTETATVWKGYMEGAVRSGVRGAKEVIRHLIK